MRSGEMRADRAEGDSQGWSVGEVWDGPHEGKGHEPRAEDSNSLPKGSRKPRNLQKGRGRGKLQLRV